MQYRRTSILLAVVVATLSVAFAAANAWAASSEKVLYSFNPQTPDGFYPYSNLISDSAGNLYGTTHQGGVDSVGTVFELSPNGTGGWTETVLHSFNYNGSDGYSPFAGLIFDGKANLYGTTYLGGAYGNGTVFQLSPNGSGGWTETVLHSFNNNGSDGANPYAGLIFDTKGNLYGTTVIGGTTGLGSVFELSPNGNAGWTETVLYSFLTNRPDGAEPYGGLIFDAKGNLYGTTLVGLNSEDALDLGTVFELSPNGSGGWTETVLYTFGSTNTDGTEPYAGLIFDAQGNLYGTTLSGGTYGGGTAFELSPNGNGGWTEAVVHSFGNGSDGVSPYASLISDGAGNFYGTTIFGGDIDSGIVFELTPGQGGTWTEKVLHKFDPSTDTDGVRPNASLLRDASGNLYGTTLYDGTQGNGGTVFELSLSGSSWDEKLLYSFNTSGTDGEGPNSVIFDGQGNLYGTTSNSGTSGYGTVFELSPGPNGSWTEKLLLNFDNTDGAIPDGGLVFDSSGNLYGATNDGGTHYGYGNAFELSPESGGNWTEKVLANFGPGTGPNSPGEGNLILDAKGNLYGTTYFGGTDDLGTVFELSPNGSGGWTHTVLHSFDNNGTDGSEPLASLTFDTQGNLYGTTELGGTHGVGTVFELSPNGSGGWTETELYNFNTGTDGQYPSSSLVFDAQGDLYGTTPNGGTYSAGTVFELSPNGSGGWTETVLYSFNTNGDGQNPNPGGVIFDAQHSNLYGATSNGGTGGVGTVFKLSPSGSGGWTETVLYSFQNNGTDGQNPDSGLIFDAQGDLYGTTGSGGTDNAGTVFEITVLALACPAGTAQLGGAYSSSLSATGGVAPYTFSIISGALPPGLTLNAATGAITGTPTTGGTYSFTAQVVDSQSNTVTVGCGISVPTTQPTNTSLSLAPLSILVGSAGPIAITTKVAPLSGSGTPTGTVTYYLGTISTDNQIGTATLSNGAAAFDYNPSSLAAGDYYVVAVYSGDGTFATSDAFQSFVVTQPCTNNGNLKGNYAFLFQGWSNFNSSQTYALTGTAGSMVFDGNGNVTSGQYDRNDSIGGPTQGTLTGTYCISSNNLGTMTINAGGPAYGLAFVLQPNGNGNIIPFDAPSEASGILLKQNTSDFSTSDFTGQYSLGLIGIDNVSSRFGLVGAFTANGTANLTNGELDGEDGAKSINGAFSSANFNVTSSGRGTFSLNVAGVGTGNFAFYVVNSSQLLVVQIDPISQGLQTLFSGEVVQQQGLTYSDSDLNGVSVLGLQGLDTTCSPGCADAQLLLGTWNGAGSLSYTGDENDGGTMSSSSGSGTYSVASNGRVTLSGTGSHPPILYLTGKNAGFAVGAGEQKVGFGSMVAQSGSNFNKSSLSGNYDGGSWELASAYTCGEVGLFNLSSGSGTGTLEADCSVLAGGAFSFTYTVSSNGRGVLSSNGEEEILYLVSPSGGGSGGSFLVLPGQDDDTPTLESFVASSAAGLTLSCSAGTGEVGLAYSSALTAAGGVAPYTFSIVSGSLPPGLSLNAATGAITGTPTTAGTYAFTSKVVDSQAHTATASCSIVVAPTLKLACPTGTAQVGGAYTSALAATGGVAPYTFSIISGTLPAGLSLNSSSGAITGTPTTAGTFNFTAQVVDSQSNTATSSCSIVVSTGSTVILQENFNELTPATAVTSAGVFTAINGTNVDIVDGSICASPESGNCVDMDGTDGNSQGDLESSPITLNAGTQYNLSFDLIGSQRGVTTSTTVNFGPYSQTFVLASNDDTDGIVTVPVTVSSTTVTHLEFKSNTPGNIGALLDNVSITTGTSGPQVSCSATNSTGEVGVPFNSGTITVAGGTAPYTFAIVGTLPNGLTLNSSTGVVSGTPASSGSFSIQVTDAHGVAGSASCPFAIVSQPQITCPAGTAQVGVAYSSGFPVTGGVPPYAFTILNGSLPPGLSLNSSTGAITGTPTSPGTYNFTAQVVDSQGGTATTSYNIVVASKSPVTLSCPMGTAQVGIAYSSAFSATGGVSPYTYSIISGSLPLGLSLNSTGAITGTPTTAATYTFTVQVTDSKGNTATSSCTIVVSAASTLALTCPAGTAQVGVAYSSALSPSGGVPPYTFSSISGSPPPGLSLNLSNGAITGTPTSAGTYSFSAHIVDSQDAAATASCGIVVASATSTPTNASLTLVPSNVPVGSEGPIVMTAMVAPASGSGTPTGTVTYFMDPTELGTAPLSGGVGTFDFNPSSLAVGIYSITAVYSGGSTFSASTSSAQTLAITQAGPFAYVANNSSNSVSVINLPTGQVVNTIPVGSGPWATAISPDQKQVYVTNSRGNSVSVINAASGSVVATIPVGSSPVGMAFTPDGTAAYVVNGSSNSVSVINTASQTVVATVPVQGGPVGVAMAYTSNGTFAYVTNSASNTVSVIAVSSNTVVQTVPVGSGPRGVAVTPNSKLVYVVNEEGSTVSVISVATNTVTAIIPVGANPIGAAFTPDSSFAYVASNESNTASVIDTASASVVATIAGFNDPFYVALSADGSLAYFTNSAANVVSVVTTSSNTITGTITVGSNSTGIALASAPQAIFQITQPLSPTQQNTFNFGANVFAVQYPPGTQFSNFSMTVASVEITQAQFQQRVAGTQFASASCIVYSGAAGNCIDQQVTCSQNGSPVACPSETAPTIAVQTSFSTAQQIVNPGYLTTPIGQNNWTNIFSGLSDITVKGKTKGFSEFIAVELGTDNPQGGGTLTFQSPLASTDPREFAPGTKIPVTFQLTSLANPTQPITDAVANLTLEYVANASGQPQNTVVLNRTNAFRYESGVGYVYQLNTSRYPTGTYLLIVYGNAFAAQQVQFSLMTDQAPAFTSANATTFTTGTANTFTVTTSGFPIPGITESGPLPAGVTFVDNGNGTGTLSGTPTAAGVFDLTFTAQNGIGSSATQAFTLTVTAEANFTVLATPGSLTVPQNSGGTTTIEIKRSKGFDQLVTLSVSGMPSGVKATFDTNPTRRFSTLALSAGASVAPGTYSITVTGTAGSISHSATVTLTVTAASFTLSLTPNTVTVARSSSATSTITITPANGFSGSVTLAAAGLPAGVTASFNPNPATSSSTLTLSASDTAASGTVAVTITGTSESRSESTTLMLTVEGTFTVLAVPSSLTVPQNSGGTTTIEIKASKGFDQAVTLSASGMPSGVKATFNTNPTRRFSTLALSVGASVAPGTYTITVTGTAGGLSDSAIVTLAVTAP